MISCCGFTEKSASERQTSGQSSCTVYIILFYMSALFKVALVLASVTLCHIRTWLIYWKVFGKHPPGSKIGACTLTLLYANDSFYMPDNTSGLSLLPHTMQASGIRELIHPLTKSLARMCMAVLNWTLTDWPLNYFLSGYSTRDCSI